MPNSSVPSDTIALDRARESMVRDQLQARGIKDRRVLATMRVLPRHLFVPVAERGRAYDDCALPIGRGSTISQPVIVAQMTEALALEGTEKVLEVGTGSGYQTAILCELAGEVWSVELDAAIASGAESLLRRLGYGERLHVEVGDGSLGFAAGAPYDRILLTVAPERLPQAILDQLADGGKLVAPVGPEYAQKLVVVERRGSEFVRASLGAVKFLKMRSGS